MELGSLKTLSIFLVLIVAVVAGWIPFKKKLNSLKGHDFPRGEALASGIFLGAGLIHMLGDAADGFSKAGFDYPMAFLLCGISFLALLLLEHWGTEVKHHEGGSSTTIAVLATVMLAIHSLFAGAALGISQQTGAVVLILIAILAHKWAASFSLAIQINKSKLSFNTGLTCFIIFVLMTPLGILLGNGLIHSAIGGTLIKPVFLALAAGTFLYIGTLHGLKRSVMVERCCNLRDFSFVILGFALMAVVAIWT